MRAALIESDGNSAEWCPPSYLSDGSPWFAAPPYRAWLSQSCVNHWHGSSWGWSDSPLSYLQSNANRGCGTIGCFEWCGKIDSCNAVVGFENYSSNSREYHCFKQYANMILLQRVFINIHILCKSIQPRKGSDVDWMPSWCCRWCLLIEHDSPNMACSLWDQRALYRFGVHWRSEWICVKIRQLLFWVVYCLRLVKNENILS